MENMNFNTQFTAHFSASVKKKKIHEYQGDIHIWTVHDNKQFQL